MSDDQTTWKKDAEIINLLRNHAGFYSFPVKDDVLKSYASKLYNLPLHALEKGLEEIADNAGARFPSLGDIKNFCRNHIRSKIEDEQDEFQKKYQAEQERFDKCFANLLKAVGEDALTKYYHYWCSEFLDKEEWDILTDFGLTTKLFLKPAIFDLVDANGEPRQAIEVMKRKQKRLDDEAKRLKERGVIYAPRS